MDLRLTPEQELFVATVRQMLHGLSNECRLIPVTAESTLWNSLSEFGALDVGFGEEQLGAVEAALISRELGEVLAPGPFCDTAAVRYAFGDALDEGATTRFSTALVESGSSLTAVSETAWTSFLSGEKRGVLCGERSDRLVVAASGPGGPVIVLVAPEVAGVRLTSEETLDDTLEPVRATFDDVDHIVQVVSDADVIERLDAIGAVLTSAHAVGAAASVLGLARDYASNRKQFGRSIGSFQAIRHIMADMYMKVESSWSSVLYAASSLDEGAEDALPIASIAKAYVGRATIQVAQDALQVFGGVAFTIEHPAHRYLRRVVALADHFGSPRDHELLLGRALVSGHIVG